jgi:chorismate mutase
VRKDGNQSRMLLVDSSVLPKVFSRVLEAKELLASGKVPTAAEAARVAGISRSAFYKYRDAVYPYESRGMGKIITVYLELRDKPGVLSGVLSEFANAGANILTVNQNIPLKGRALVSISARIDRLTVPAGQLIKNLHAAQGVEQVTRVSGEWEHLG